MRRDDEPEEEERNMNTKSWKTPHVSSRLHCWPAAR
jgi:hypothetical protein